MSMHRKNRGSGSSNGSYNAPWFVNNVKRQRRRRKLAQLSRRKNR